MKRLVILGSTGSLGRQVLDVVRQNRDQFEIIGLACEKSAGLIQEQAREFNVKNISIGNEEMMIELAKHKDADLIVNVLSGNIGIAPTFAALHAGKNVALGNKEAMVSVGEILMKEAQQNNAKIIPIDSELTSLFQMLEGKPSRDIEKIIITASGGPFFGMNREQLQDVTVEDALKHPTWRMGSKITLDSATLMNKAFEMICASYLFNVSADQIEIVIQRESIVHALVQFRDGNTMAVMSPADMRIPIHYALFYPDRIPNNLPRLDLTNLPRNALHFEKPNCEIFKGPLLAKRAIKGEFPLALLNEANDLAIQKFLNREIKFLEIYSFIEQYVLLTYEQTFFGTNIRRNRKTQSSHRRKIVREISRK